MEFLFPFPAEAGGPERGFVKGFVDVIFEHEGRSYFGDWKTDRLPAWDAAAVAAHVDANYALQERLYALALVRMLGITDAAAYEARFGGTLYVFVRGLGRSPDAIRGRRPTLRRDRRAGSASSRGDAGPGRRRDDRHARRTRTRGRRTGRAISCRPAPTSTSARCTWRSRRAAGRRRCARRGAARVRAGRARVAGRARRRRDAARRWRRSAPASRGSASPTTIAPRSRAWPKRGSRCAALAPLVGRPGDYRPFIVDGDFLYHERDLRLEQRLADALARAPGATPLPRPRGTARAGDQAAGLDASRRAAIDAAAPAVARRHLRRPRHGQDRAHRRHRARLAGAGHRGDAHRDRGADRQGGQPHRRAARATPTRPSPATLHRLLGLTGGATGCAAASSATTRTAPCPTPPSSSTKRRWSGSR